MFLRGHVLTQEKAGVCKSPELPRQYPAQGCRAPRGGTTAPQQPAGTSSLLGPRQEDALCLGCLLPSKVRVLSHAASTAHWSQGVGPGSARGCPLLQAATSCPFPPSFRTAAETGNNSGAVWATVCSKQGAGCLVRLRSEHPRAGSKGQQSPRNGRWGKGIKITLSGSDIACCCCGVTG